MLVLKWASTTPKILHRGHGQEAITVLHALQRRHQGPADKVQEAEEAADGERVEHLRLIASLLRNSTGICLRLGLPANGLDGPRHCPLNHGLHEDPWHR